MPLTLSPSVPRLQDLAALATTNAQKLTLGAGGATLGADATGRLSATSAVAKPFRAGGGLPLGAPVGTITLATAGAGGLTGVYQYAYTETDANGETTLSGAVSITAAGNTIAVTVPLPRRGTGERHLYRTAAGGATFKLLFNFGGGNAWYQTLYNDNIADVSLGATAPGVDTTSLYELEINQGVKNIRTHPNQGTGAADLTLATGDPATAGAYALDAYGQLFARVGAGAAYGALCTGAPDAFAANWLGTTADGAAALVTFRVSGTGQTTIAPTTLTDAVRPALSVTATLPAVTTAARYGVQIGITGAGSSAFSQTGLRVDTLAGYTGASANYGIASAQATASAGAAHGVYGNATGASVQNVGITGRASGGTQNIGVFAGLSLDPDALAISAALVASNGATGSAIMTLLSNTTQRYQMLDNGNATYGAPLLADSRLSLDEPSGGILTRAANLRVTAHASAGNNLFFGHNNTAYLCTLGALSSAGSAYLGFYCYHGPTANTMRFAGSSNAACVLTVSPSGSLSFQTSAAGTVDTDVTLATRWTLSVAGDMTMVGQITLADAKNIVLPTVTGVKIGTATNQKLGFFNATPVVQQAGASAAAIAAITDANAKSAVSALQNALAALGLASAPA